MSQFSEPENLSLQRPEIRVLALTPHLGTLETNLKATFSDATLIPDTTFTTNRIMSYAMPPDSQTKTAGAVSSRANHKSRLPCHDQKSLPLPEYGEPLDSLLIYEP